MSKNQGKLQPTSLLKRQVNLLKSLEDDKWIWRLKTLDLCRASWWSPWANSSTTSSWALAWRSFWQGHCLTTQMRSTPPTHEIKVARISQRGSVNLFDCELCLLVEWDHELMLVDETFILAKQLRWPAETCQGHGRMGTGAEAHKTAGRRGVHRYSDVITGGGWKRSIRSFTLKLSDLSVCFLSCAGSRFNTLNISKISLET